MVEIYCNDVETAIWLTKEIVELCIRGWVNRWPEIYKRPRTYSILSPSVACRLSFARMFFLCFVWICKPKFDCVKSRWPIRMITVTFIVLTRTTKNYPTNQILFEKIKMWWEIQGKRIDDLTGPQLRNKWWTSLARMSALISVRLTWGESASETRL